MEIHQSVLGEGGRSWVAEGERITLFNLCNYYDNATCSCNKVGEELIGLRSKKKEEKKEMIAIYYIPSR